MAHLEDWVKTWDEEAIHAGTPGKGAFDGWHKTALDIEFARAHNLLVAGGSIDVYKCFDQINRSLIFKLAKEAGAVAASRAI